MLSCELVVMVYLRVGLRLGMLFGLLWVLVIGVVG